MRRVDISPLSRLMQRVDAIAEGASAHDTVPTGFPSVDRVLGGGLRRGDLIVLGGDVGSGKSALALAMALRMAERGPRVDLYSAEMTVERLLERSLAIEGRVRVDDVRKGAVEDAERVSIGVAAVRLRDHPPQFAVLPGTGVAGLGETVRGAAELPAVVIIDGLNGLVGTGGRGLDDETADVVRQLKSLALDLDVVVLVTAALPGLDRSRRDLRPTLDDFGARGLVKQHADVVLAIFREDMYDPGAGVEGATELLVLKNRNGTTGYVDLYFYRQWMRFEDMLEPDR